MSQPTPSPYQSILYCTDFSPTADRAFNYAIDAARRRPGCALHLLHVIPEPEAQFWKTYIYELDDIDAKAKSDVDAKIEQAYLSRVPPEMALNVVIRVGKVSAEILSVAEQLSVDLIILGRRGHSALGEVIFGGVTDRIVRKASCAVLVIPEK